MKTVRRALLACYILSAYTCLSQGSTALPDYPETRTEEKVKNYHGTEVRDSYAWLSDEDQAKSWVIQQDSLTTSFLRELPFYPALKEKVTSLSQVSERTELPAQSDAAYYYLKQEEGRQWGLYRRTAASSEKIELEFNPRRAFFTIPSPDDRYLALGIMGQGRVVDWQVLDLSSSEMLEENLTGTSMGNTRLAWKNDASGFYYVSSNKVDSAGRRSEIAIKSHVIGQEYVRDEVVYRPENDGVKFELGVTQDDKYLVVEERSGASTLAKVSLIETKELQTELISDREASYLFLGNSGSLLLFETDHEAPNGKIVAINAKKLKKGFKEVVPEGEASILGYQSAGGSMLPMMAGDKIVVPTQKDLKLKITVYETNGTQTQEIFLPSGGLYFNTNGQNALSGSRLHSKVLTRFIGLTEPNTIFEIDVTSGTIAALERAQVNFNSNDYASEIVFSESKDGTRIPISLTYKKGTKIDGSAPLMMQVYGAIAFTNYPYFQGDYITWLEMGGIHGVAHIRGGGAYGDKWHKSGVARNKQNGIDDYLSALEWVVDNRYTSRDKLVVNGVSAGTIPLAAALVQKPRLMAAAVAHYGMFDMIGYEANFEDDATHNYMIPDLGKASDPEDFQVLQSYSPYQNVDLNQNYPAVLALTSDADSPLNVDSYKMIAKLQASNSQGNPMLLQVAWGSGHSMFGSQSHPPFLTFTDELAFLVRVLGLETAWLEK